MSNIGFDIVMYSIFWEIIQVLCQGVITFGKRNFFKSFVFAHSHFLVLCPSRFYLLKVRINEDSW